MISTRSYRLFSWCLCLFIAVTTTQCTGCISPLDFSTTSRSKHTDPLARIAEDGGYQYEGLANVLAQIGNGKSIDVNKPLENEHNYDHTTALHAAAALGNKSIMEKLLTQAGADVNVKDKNNRTPLHLAIQEGNTEVVKLLIEKGADIVSKPGPYEYPPLLQAVAGGNKEIVQALLNTGKVSIQLRDTLRQYSAAHIAAYNGKLEVLKSLLQEAPDLLDSRTEYQNTPLQEAAENGKTEVVEWLLKNYPDSIQCTNRIQDTPLHDAAHYGHMEVAKVLLKANKNLLNAVNTFGETALHEAVKEQNAEMVGFLLKEGADTSIEGGAGSEEKTPLELAQKTHNKVIIDLLTNPSSS